MTLADRISEVLLEQGPLPGCVIATTVRKQKAEVLAALHGNPDRFVKTGKARASRWSVREAADEVRHGVTHYTVVDELAAQWERDLELDHYTATSFVAWFVEIGYLERVDGNGRVRVTERGSRASARLNGAGA